MSFLSGIGNFFKSLAAVFGYAQQRDYEKNAPEMKAAAAGRTDQQIKDDAAKAIADGNTAEIEKGIAE